MTPDEAAAKMRQIRETLGGDIERAHYRADDLMGDVLAELGYGDMVDVYEDIEKWYA